MAKALARTLLALAVVASAGTASVAAGMQSRAEAHELGSWIAAVSWPWRQVGSDSSRHPALVGLTALMVVSWCGVVLGVRQGLLSKLSSRIGLLAWIVPYAVAPPLLSRDAYAYVAQGELLRRGVDPYHHPIAVLGAHSAVVRAVDAQWRGTLSPYGPIGLRVEQLAAWLGHGSEGQALVALRVMSLLALLATVVIVRGACSKSRRELATWLLFSPLTLLHLIGGMHLESLLCPLLALALVLVARRRLWLAGSALGLAVDMKATAAPVLLAALVFVAVRAGRRAFGWLVAGATVGGTCGLLAYLQDPMGWVGALGTPARGWAPSTPSTTVYLLLSETLSDLRSPVPSWLSVTCQLTMVGLGVVVAGWLLLRAARFSLPTLSAAVTLALVVAAPVLWPWYLAPAATLLLLSGRSGLGGPLALGSLPALIALPIDMVPSQRLTLLVELLAVGWFLALRSPRLRPLLDRSGLDARTLPAPATHERIGEGHAFAPAPTTR